nr:AAA family ATPase [Bradyrhizobium sp. 76]
MLHDRLDARNSADLVEASSPGDSTLEGQFGPSHGSYPERADGIPDHSPGRQLGSSVAPRFTPIALDEVTITAEPPWLIEGLIPARGLACIIGEPKCGKSFMTSDMLCTVAQGAPYAGRATLKGPVIYLTGEGVSGFKRRLVAIRQHRGIEGQGVPFYLIEDVPDLGSQATDLAQLLAELDTFIAQRCLDGPRAIVLDTLARCMGDGDENSARDMGRFVNRCGVIESHFGCVVVVVHHVGKDPSRGGRGSNALNGAVDVTMLVEKGEAHSTVTIEEMKDGREGQTWQFRLLSHVLEQNLSDPVETMPEVSTCVVEIVSEPTTSKPSETKSKKPPKGVKGDLLKVIRRAIEEAGERNVHSLAVPNNVPAVGRENLKRYCASMDWQDPRGKPDSFRAMLNKTLNTLRAANLIGFDKEWIWLT